MEIIVTPSPSSAVAALIERLGFYSVDLGPPSVGGRLVQFPGGPLPGQNFVRFD